MSTAGVENNGLPPISDDALSKAFGKILEHPELISMVAGVLGGEAQKNEQQSVATTSSVAEHAEGGTQGANGDALAALVPMLGKLTSVGANGTVFKHETLLCALKPYLNGHRCDTIDLIIRMSKISSIIGGMR